MESYASLKRKDLQKLAKKHGLRANAKNEDIIRELSELLSENKPDTTVEPVQVDNETTNTPTPADSAITEQPAQEEHEKQAESEDDFMTLSASEEKVEPLYPDLSNEITTANTNTPTITAPTLYPVLSEVEAESVSESDSEPFETKESEPETTVEITPETTPQTTVETAPETTVVKSSVVTKTPSKATKTPSKTTKTPSKVTKTPATTKTPAKVTKVVPEARRQNIIQQKKITRADDIKERQKTKRSGLAAANNKVSGANRPTKPKVKQTAENVAKAAATQKAKDKLKKKGMVDFDKIHAKQFNNMASIAEHQKSKDSRALEVLYGGLNPPQHQGGDSQSAFPSLASYTASFSSASTTASTSSTSSTSSSKSTTSSSSSSTGFSFKPPTFETKKEKGAPTPAKSKILSKATKPSSSTPVKFSTASSSSTTPSINRLTDTKRTAAPVTIPAFQSFSTISSTTSTSSSSTSSNNTSVLSKVKDTLTEAKTPKTPKQQKPRPVFTASKTPLKPTTTTNVTTDKKQTPAPKRTNPTTDSTTTSPSAPSTEPPTKKSKPDVPATKPSTSYIPHLGPVPKFESSSFSSFSPAPCKMAAKPKYDAKKSLAMSAKKTPKSIVKKSAVTENKENSVNSIVC